MRTYRKLIAAPITQALPANPVVLDTTTLNSLANLAGQLSGPFDADGAELADFELLVGFAVAPTLDALVELYLLPTVDGTNFAHGTDGAAALRDANMLAGAFKVQAQTAAHRCFLKNVALPLGPFKTLLINKAAQSFAASGNTLKMRPVRILSEAAPPT